MARILIVCWPYHGHVYPMLSIAAGLRTAGHECAFLTGPRAIETVTGQGYRAFSFRKLQLDEHYAKLFADNAGAHGWFRMTHVVASLQECFLDSIPDQLEDLDEVLDEWRPDVIACDMLVWGPILITSERMPVAVCSVFPMFPVPGRGIPPFGLGMPLPRTQWSRSLCSGVSAMARVVRARFQKRANLIRQRYGLPGITQSFHEFCATLPVNLVPCSSEFDYRRTDLPASTHYIGPCLWNPTSRAGANLDFLEAIPRDRSWIHATEGTLHGGKPVLLKAAVEGFRDLSAEIILTTGQDRDPATLGLGPLSPNIHITQWVSHSELLPHVDVMITTGGAGSVLAALSAGVPLIVIPTAWDKPEIAQRVVEAGAGLRLSPKQCTPKALLAATQRVLREPAFRANARMLSESFRPLGGPARAAQLIGALCPVPAARLATNPMQSRIE